MGRKAIASVKQEVVRGNVSVMLAEKDEKFPIDAGVVFYEFLRSMSGQMVSSDMVFLILMSMKGKLMERGYKNEDIDKVQLIIADVLSSRRDKFTQEFMG